MERQGVSPDADLGLDLRAAVESRRRTRNDVPVASGRCFADGHGAEVAAL